MKNPLSLIRDIILDAYIYARHRYPERVAAGSLGVGVVLMSIGTLVIFRNSLSGIVVGLATIPTAVLILYSLRGTVVLYRVQDILKSLMSEVEGSKEKHRIEQDGKEIIRNYNTDWFGPHSSFNVDDIEFRWYTDTPEQEPGGSEIICLKESTEEAVNKAQIAIDYANRAVLRTSRSYLSDDLNAGVTTFVSRDILEKNEEKEAIETLKEDFLPHEIESHDTTLSRAIDRYNQIETIRSSGFFGSVFIGECSKMTDIDVKMMDKGEIDANNLLAELLDITSELEDGQTKDGEFRGHWLDCKILLVHRWTDAEEMYDDIANYIGGSEYDTIYVLAIGRATRNAEKVTKRAKKLPGVVDVDSDTYLLDTDEGIKDRYYAQLHSIKE